MTKAEEKSARAAAFLAKANKHLGWLQPFLDEMRVHSASGDFAQFERVLHVVLSLVATVHESLADAAKSAGHRTWHESLVRVRQSDPLLFYLWKARDAEIHDALVKWQEGYEAEVIVVDDAKVNPLISSWGDLSPHDMTVRLFHHLFGAKSQDEFVAMVKSGQQPAADVLERAGLALLSSGNTFVFTDFAVRDHGKIRTVTAPMSHDEKPAVPSAFSAIQRARLFYSMKSSELAALASQR